MKNADKEKLNSTEVIEKDRKLTNRQREFAKLYVDGIYSNTECARRAGYADGAANVHASRLLNGKDYPLVVEHIAELRQERERKYGVTLIGQLKRFHDLSRSAEEEGHYSAAINAEKIRSSLGGLTVDRRENQHIHSVDNMTREEIASRLAQLRNEYPTAFIEGTIVDVPGKETVEESKSLPAPENSRDQD